jgi:hypothetical protein
MSYLSASQIDMFYRCGEQYRRRYIENERIPPGIAAYVGTGLHGAAEMDFKSKMSTGEDLPAALLKEVAAETFQKKISDEGVFIPHEDRSTAKKDIADGMDMTTKLIEPFLEFAKPINPALVEHRAIIEVPEIPPILGFIDLYTADKRLSDIKTGGRSWTQDKADTATQPTVYREMVKRELGEYPERFTIDCLVTTKTPKYSPVETTRRDEDFEALVAKIKVMMAAINAGIFMPSDPTAWMCSRKFCGYYLTCPYIPAHKKTIPKSSE